MRTELRPDWLTLLAGSMLLATTLGCGGGGGNRPVPTPTARGPFPIAMDLDRGLSPAVAWGDGRYLVAYNEGTSRLGKRLVALRLAPDGSVIDPAPLLLSEPADGSHFDPATASYGGGSIAFDGTGFGVFYSGDGTFRSDRPSGQIIGFTSVPPAGPLLIPTTAVAEQATFSGARTFITSPVVAAANAARFVGIYQLGFQLVPSAPFFQVLGQYVTVRGDSIAVRKTGALGGAVLPPVAGMIGSSTTPGVASNAVATLVAWVEVTVAEDDIRDLTYSLQAAAIAPGEVRRVRLADVPPGSQGVAVASDGTSFLVAWNAAAADDPARQTEIRAIRVVPGGGPGGSDRIEPPNGFVVADGPSLKSLAGVAFGGGTYLVIWIEDLAIRGARIPEDETTVAEFEVDPGPSTGAALTADDDGFLVVFERRVGDGAELVGRFVGASE